MPIPVSTIWITYPLSTRHQAFSVTRPPASTAIPPLFPAEMVASVLIRALAPTPTWDVNPLTVPVVRVIVSPPMTG